MMLCMTDTEAHLEGNWTLTGVTRNLGVLAHALQQLNPERKRLRMDCGRMTEADISGLQFLRVWMQCARLRGVEPVLFNVPEKLKHTMQALMGPLITDISLFQR